MKKFTLLVAAIAVCSSINAQKQDVIIDDFENGEGDFMACYFEAIDKQ